MKTQEQLSALISVIYDAALDPADRSDVLEKIAAFTGGDSSGLILKHSLAASETAPYCFIGPHRESLQAYSEDYPELEPMGEAQACGAEQVVSATDLVPVEEFRRGRFYQEWAQPQGWVDVASALIEKSATSSAFLSVVRNEASGMVDAERRRRMAVIIPPVRRALLIGKTLNLKQAESACFADILDGLSAGMILIDAKARVVHAIRREMPFWRRPISCARWAAGWLPAIPRPTRPCATYWSPPRTATPLSASRASLCHSPRTTGSATSLTYCR